MKASDTDLGMVAKIDIIDPGVADAALRSGERVHPEGRFGTILRSRQNRSRRGNYYGNSAQSK
jgi:hypothetical protein